MKINSEIEQALQLVERGHNVFVTGRAGTGKSTLLAHLWASSDVNTAVVAPTGVAALNVGGHTIHRFFGFPANITPEQIISGETRPRRNLDVISTLQRLIVDEVSMVRADLLDCVDATLRRWGPSPGTPFGGVQMVLVGDPFQLPPVVTDHEAGHFAGRYQTPYFFSSDALMNMDFEVVELTEVFRQTDGVFVDLLNAIRDGSVTNAELATLNSRVDPDFNPPGEEPYVTLTTTRALADKVNNAQLEALPGEEFVSDAAVTGDFPALPTKTELRFKVGAQVMLLTNDPADRWVNGSLGIVQSVGWPERATVSVLVIDTGEIVEVEPFQWTVSQPRLSDGRLTYAEVGTFKQLPFDLAWAATIHKSQGRTFDRLIIDLGRGTFAKGQLYVALSRSRSLEGLVLRQPVEPRHVLVEAEVSRFFARRTLAPVNLNTARIASVALNATGQGNFDRIVEIAVVITEGGEVIEEFDSIIHPLRDLTGSGDHGITAHMASMAPSFAESWATIAPSIDGCVIVAHGLAPTARLLQLEIDRCDGATADLGIGICTLQMFGTDLTTACAEHAVAYDGSERALTRARALRSLLQLDNIPDVPSSPVTNTDAGWAVPRLQRRPDATPDRNGPAGGTDDIVRCFDEQHGNEPEATYARTLAMLLDDGRLDHDERSTLDQVATRLDLDDAIRQQLHAAYCDSIVTAAARDAVVTDAEWNYILAVHGDMGLTAPQRPQEVSPTDIQLFKGMRVCLTGLRESSAQVTELDLEQLIREHGLVVVGSVGRRCGLVVAAERSSMSRKASKARQLGIPILETDEFLDLISTGEIGDDPSPQPIDDGDSESGETRPTARRRSVDAPIDIEHMAKGLSIDKYSRTTLRAVVVHVDPDGSLDDLPLFNAVFGFMEFSHRSARRIEAIGAAIDAERGDPIGNFADRMASRVVTAVEAVEESGNAAEVARELVIGSDTDAVVLSAGMQVCFTGTALVDGKRIQRKHLHAAAKRAGLVATEDVSSRTSVLVCPDVQAKPQGKFKKAIGYGIPVISVSAFMEQIPLDED